MDCCVSLSLSHRCRAHRRERRRAHRAAHVCGSQRPARARSMRHSAQSLGFPSVLLAASAQGAPMKFPSVGALEAAPRGGTPSRIRTESPHPSPTHPNGIVKAPTHEYFIEK